MLLPSHQAGMAVAVFTAGLLEGVGIPWPGALIIAGAAAGLGAGTAGVPLAAACFTAGYCLGSAMQYLLGRLLGGTVLGWLPSAQRCRMDELTRKHGAAIVLWTRPLAVGNYVSIPAGISRMPVSRFLLYTFLGISPWAMAMAAGGWLLGGQVGAVNAWLTRWFLPAAVACGGALALYKLGTLVLNRFRQTPA